MSNAANASRRPSRSFRVALLLCLLTFTSMTLQRASANPLLNFTREPENLTTESSAESSTGNSVENWTDNSTEIAPNTDVYVIKAVVYEIGILMDTDNTTSGESAERQEKVDISLYNAPQEDEFS